MSQSRTRHLVAGSVVVTLLAGLLTLLALAPAQANPQTGSCAEGSITLSGGVAIRASSAGGTTDTEVIATVKRPDGLPNLRATVRFFASDTGSSPMPVSKSQADNPSGEYRVAVTPGATVGDGANRVTAVIDGTACQAVLLVTQFGAPHSITASVGPNPTAVSPTPRSPATDRKVEILALVQDAGGRMVTDAMVHFELTAVAPSAAVPDTFTNGTRGTRVGYDGNQMAYRDTITVSESPSRQTFVATVVEDPAKSRTVELRQYGRPERIVVAPAAPIPANGVTKTPVKARVTDIVGIGVPGVTVTFTAVDGPSAPPSPATARTNDEGDAQTEAGPASTPGSSQVFASCNCATTQQHKTDVRFDPPVPGGVRLSLAPASIPADGSSTSTATVIVTDQAGVALAGSVVSVTPSGQTPVRATDQGGGNYRATLTATRTPGDVPVTAEATKNGVNKASNPVTLRQTATTTAPPSGGGGAGSGGTTTAPSETTDPAQGYSLVGEDGSLYAFGTAKNLGDMRGKKLNAPIIGVAYTPGGNGYWLVAKDGGIFSFGDADFYGSMGGEKINSPVLGMAASPTGKGYWLFAGDGGIFTFGDADFFGSMGDQKLNAPVINMEPLKSGNGYWLVAGDGGIFTFGQAEFFGSRGDERNNEPIFDMTSTDTDNGYWLVARDGGVFSFGDAAGKFFGSGADANPRPSRVIGMDATPNNQGYWIADATGRILAFGNAKNLGDRNGANNPAPMVSFSAVPGLRP